MTETDVPRPVRVASALTFLLAPVGLFLIGIGWVEVLWWGRPETAALTALFARIQVEFGTEPAAVLRGRGGAIELIVIGAVCLAGATLAPMLRRGRRWARTVIVWTAVATSVVGLIGIGIDATESATLTSYFQALQLAPAAAALIPQVQSLLYPAWYSWAEDAAQGLQVLATLGLLIAVAVAQTTHGSYFVRKNAGSDPPDEWDAAITRIRRQATRDGEPS